MADSHENNIDNVTQIVLPSQQDKMKKDLPQVINITLILSFSKKIFIKIIFFCSIVPNNKDNFQQI